MTPGIERAEIDYPGDHLRQCLAALEYIATTSDGIDAIKVCAQATLTAQAGTAHRFERQDDGTLALQPKPQP